MKVTTLDERSIHDIGHAFGYYDYGEETEMSFLGVSETSKISSILHTQNSACVCEISVIFFVFRYTLGLPQAPGLAGGPDYV